MIYHGQIPSQGVPQPGTKRSMRRRQYIWHAALDVDEMTLPWLMVDMAGPVGTFILFLHRPFNIAYLKRITLNNNLVTIVYQKYCVNINSYMISLGENGKQSRKKE